MISSSNFIWGTVAESLGRFWNGLLQTNLDVSSNSLWPDLFKATSGLFALCFLGVVIAYNSATHGVSEEMMDSLRVRGLVNRYRLIAPLHVWLVLNVPFSISLSLMSASWLVSAIVLPGVALVICGVALWLDRHTLADYRGPASLVGVSFLAVEIVLISRQLSPIGPYMDTSAMAVAVLWLFVGVACAIASIYWSDVPHALLRLGKRAGVWHTEEAAIIQVNWKDLEPQYASYKAAVANGTCPEIPGLRTKFLRLKEKREIFCSFKIDGEGATLYGLKPPSSPCSRTQPS